ncbi:DNA polymerase III subunit gamma/tau [Salinivirga cyanobacteriivorans]|uniref:DNA polymerase III subunit gamma/tau n=1 Tax=Salinivirga cyanobacteriivorans TaxID=1307839 RepID=A0A0S2I401_9BACT|nr:DNA polymerase III subunit gamma/tau [Salinivirga cyanobacteriivorans]
MENYIVSARKYRPHSFDTVVGQRSVTKTLKNAVQNNRLAHAYLFCGPRGVGKTSIARIFAKTINCLNPTEDFEACGECESCQAFNENRSYNIHELDAASKNKVEDIHGLIEQVRIAPQVGKYSVYIIDEVHMLSASAFNAFLKTLEEPPAHAIFVLATTEKHKILPTIISRCQVFDFNRITVEEAVEHLKFVAEKENLTYEESALHVIAQKADGGMRDALSIFDQIASFSGGSISYQQTIENLNVLDYDFFFRIVDHSLANEVSELFLIYDEILQRGFDGQHFITGLAKHLRDLLVSKNPNSLKLLDVSGDIREKYLEQAQKCPIHFLFKGLKLLSEAESRYRTSKDQRLTVELSLYELGVVTVEKKKVVRT